tara:strand:+ start:641 stop:1084 length:444 start_codon:yes stop_codon:yes gene_type:complete
LTNYKLFIFLLFTLSVSGQTNISLNDSISILKVLKFQEEAWNSGNINKFMEGYLKSEKIVFTGSNGSIYGWEETKKRYLNKYSNRTLMGNLKFKIINFQKLSENIIQMQGSFYLKRKINDSKGFFSLIWKKENENWFIISDHTSVSK